MADIGQMEVDLADMEARNIRREADRTQSIGSTIGAPIQRSLGAMENISRLDESVRVKEENLEKEQQAKALLAKGVESIGAYGNEIGFEQAEVEKFKTLARGAKDLLPIFELMKKQADNKLGQDELARFSQYLQSGQNIENDEEYNKFINQGQIELSKLKTKLGRDEGDKRLRGMKEQRDSKSSGRALSAGKLVDKFGELIPSRTSDEKAIRDIQKALVFGSRGGQRVLGTSINKQVAIQDALDTITGITEGEFEGTQQIGQEIASIIAQVLSTGGGTTEADRRAMFPNSWAGTINNQIQEIKGSPVDSIPKPLLQQLKKMLLREKNFWDSRVTDMSKSLSGSLFTIFNREAIGPDGKPVRVRKADQEAFANWLISQDNDQRTIAERIGKKRDDLTDLIFSEEDKKKFTELSSKVNPTMKKTASFEERVRDAVNGESSTPTQTKTTQGKIRYKLPNGKVVSVDSSNTKGIEKLNEIGAERI